jgi:RNA polymerase sigma-70 factor (ECF subfamily)
MDIIDSDSLDQTDMTRLVSGEDAALNDLMSRHGAAIFQFLFRMLGNEDDASDLAQETFVRVYQNRSRFKSGAKFGAWIYTIAGNLARNHYRWRARHPHVSLDAKTEAAGDSLPCDALSPREAAEAMERADAVQSAVRNLPGEMRETIILCEWQELPVAEAAAILKTTPKAVESRLYRARQLLREKLKAWL